MRDVLMVAEIGINHNGDMSHVQSMIENAAEAGFDYVKFQKRDVHVTTDPEKANTVKSTPWGDMQYLTYKLRLEGIDYDEVDSICNAYNIGWFGSPWDVASVQYLASYSPEYIKVASATVTDHATLAAIKDTNIPVIISTGMSTKEQFDSALRILGREQVKYILACTSTYPTANNEMNMQFMRTLADQYPWAKIGFSNHNPGVLFATSSVLYGAEMIEVHVTLDRAMFGSDQAASIEFAGQKKLCHHVKALLEGEGDGAWHVYGSEWPVIKNLRWKDFS